MKKTFNIYGERNSGTNFLKSLIEQNFYLTPNMGQKHKLVETPVPSEDHITFCIIRNLNDWLCSTFKNPYHMWDNYTKNWGLTPNDQHFLISFINKKMRNSKKDPCAYDINLGEKYNLVETRYLKYDSYKQLPHKVLINLDFLQHSDENKIKFINFIAKEYNLKLKPFNNIEKYKGGQGDEKGFRTIKFKKAHYPQIDVNKIKSYNKEIEEEINNLTFKAC